MQTIYRAWTDFQGSYYQWPFHTVSTGSMGTSKRQTLSCSSPSRQERNMRVQYQETVSSPLVRSKVRPAMLLSVAQHQQQSKQTPVTSTPLTKSRYERCGWFVRQTARPQDITHVFAWRMARHLTLSFVSLLHPAKVTLSYVSRRTP